MSLSKKVEPLKVICFNCKIPLLVKYVQSTGNYSQKNNWEYWTKNKANRKRYLCDDCLVNLYTNYKPEFRKLISDKNKRAILRQYIKEGTIKRTLPLPTFIKNDKWKCRCICQCECCKRERERERESKIK